MCIVYIYIYMYTCVHVYIGIDSKFWVYEYVKTDKQFENVNMQICKCDHVVCIYIYTYKALL